MILPFSTPLSIPAPGCHWNWKEHPTRLIFRNVPIVHSKHIFWHWDVKIPALYTSPLFQTAYTHFLPIFLPFPSTAQYLRIHSQKQDDHKARYVPATPLHRKQTPPHPGRQTKRGVLSPNGPLNPKPF